MAVAHRFNVRTIPTVLILRNGQEVQRLDGLITDEDLQSAVERAGIAGARVVAHKRNIRSTTYLNPGAPRTTHRSFHMLKAITFEVVGEQRLLYASCQQRVKRLLKAVQGVTQARARVVDQRIDVLFDETQLQGTAIATRLKEAGYEANVSSPVVDPGKKEEHPRGGQVADLELDVSSMVCEGCAESISTALASHMRRSSWSIEREGEGASSTDEIYGPGVVGGVAGREREGECGGSHSSDKRKRRIMCSSEVAKSFLSS